MSSGNPNSDCGGSRVSRAFQMWFFPATLFSSWAIAQDINLSSGFWVYLRVSFHAQKTTKGPRRDPNQMPESSQQLLTCRSSSSSTLRPLQMSQLVTLFHPIGRDYTFHKSARVRLGPTDTVFVIRWLTWGSTWTFAYLPALLLRLHQTICPTCTLSFHPS